MRLSFSLFYRIPSGLIRLGFLMLVQPFSLDLFNWGFQVVLAGIVVFMVVDHWHRREPDDVD